MQESTGKFLPVDSKAYKAAISRMGPGNEASMPTLTEGEIVQIKGVDFRVTRIKMFSGKLGLKMVHKG